MKIKNYLFCIVLTASLLTVHVAANTRDHVDSELDSRNNVGETRTDRQQQGAGVQFISLIALFFGLSGVGLGILTFVKVNKISEEVHKQKAAKTRETVNFKNEISALTAKVDTLESEILNVKDDYISKLQSVTKSQFRNDENVGNDISCKSQSAAKESSDTPFKEYFGTPNGGVFTSGTNSIIPGNSLYVIYGMKRDRSANFSYLDTPEAASVAKRSISRFVESGCIVAGNDRAAFSRVVTVKPGKVVKTSSGWKIESKAVVNFS